MMIDHNYTRVFKLRSVASQLLLAFLALGVVYAESDGLTIWTTRTLGSTLAITLFVACSAAFAFAPNRWDWQTKALIWAEFALVMYLFMTAGRIELMHLYSESFPESLCRHDLTDDLEQTRIQERPPG